MGGHRPLSVTLLVLLLLASGCLGLFGDEAVDAEPDVDEPPTLVYGGVEDIDFGGTALIAGTVGHEHPAEVKVTVALSIPWGTVHVSPDEAGNWEFRMSGLNPGTYFANVTAKDSTGQQSQTISHSFNVNPPVEVDVILSMGNTEVLFEPDSMATASGQVVHADLDSCTVSATDEEGAIQQLGLDTESGSFVLRIDMLGREETDLTRTVTASCGRWTISQASETVHFTRASEVIADADGDGVADENDGCPEGDSFISSVTTDWDGDGCYDISEDLDDDDDGVADPLDNCPKGQLNWFSTPDIDKDGDGCLDATEDDDDDGDGILDAADSCLDSPYGWSSTFANDHDRDGCKDSSEDDDDDSDTIPDLLDACPKGVVGWVPDASTDRDGDGCRDSDEDDDDDNDLVLDANDTCPDTTLGVPVDEYGCADYQRDTDGDGVTDDLDLCPGTPTGMIANEQGCADLDGDGVFANVDQCPGSQRKWTVDAAGCNVLQHPVPWNGSGPYTTDRFGRVGTMMIQTTSGNWRIQDAWDGNHTYLFIFNQKSNSYMSNLWGQNVGDLLGATPANTHVFFGSYDSDYANDVSGMKARVDSWLGNQPQEVRDSWSGRLHYVNERGWDVDGSLRDVIGDWSKFYYGIDRFQRWRELGSLFDWQTSSCCYRLDYIANEPNMWNKEFEVELRRTDPAVTVIDIWSGERHSGGWGGGHTSYLNGTLPNAATMQGFNTMEVYMHHACSEHRDRYGIDDDGDGTTDRYGGCHEWDYIQYLYICDAGNSSVCGTEIGRYITTYGREGKWITDTSALLWLIKDGGERRFRYSGANGGWLNVSIILSTWDDDGMRPVHGESAFSGGTFNSEYNNQSRYKRVHEVNSSSAFDKVEIVSWVTGHGFGNDPNNCAEFCNHEHRFSMNGHDATEDHPLAGNSSVVTDRQGCRKTMDEGTVANQYGSWPYGRAGWCPGQQTDLWLHDITGWITINGTNDLLYQGLWNGQHYTETSSNPNIRANIMIVYYENISNAAPTSSHPDPTSGQVCQPSNTAHQPSVSEGSEMWARDERRASVEE